MSERRQARLAARLGGWLLTWTLLAGTWLLLVDTISVAELSAGAAAALVGTLATGLVRAHAIRPLRPRLGLLPALARQAVAVPLDLWLLLRELVRALAGRHPPGRMYAVPVHVRDRGARANARRAAAEALGSLAPNTIVLGVDEEKAVVHQLAARAPGRASVREIGQ